MIIKIILIKYIAIYISKSIFLLLLLLIYSHNKYKLITTKMFLKNVEYIIIYHLHQI